MGNQNRKIKVVVVDDSALIRSILKEIIDREKDMKVVGTAPDPLVAREMIRNLDPDVITLDVEMPRMDGLNFLERLMRLKPTPVLMISTLTEYGSEVALRALELGAVDFLPKPKIDVQRSMEDYAEEITAKIRAAAGVSLKPRREIATVLPSNGPDAVLPRLTLKITSREKLIIIGASTGGTEALKEVLTQLPANSPGTLITQHMPQGFTKSFAARLDSLCQVRVKEAEDGDVVEPGHVYLAPGSAHLLLERRGSRYVCKLSDAEPVHRHRPSVDVLFRSAANVAGKNALGVILTGMGRDGAQGMREMRDAGALTIAQDEASCVVFGMPKAAMELGGVGTVLPLQEIARGIVAGLCRDS